jgi:hypothetical protein
VHRRVQLGTREDEPGSAAKRIVAGQVSAAEESGGRGRAAGGGEVREEGLDGNIEG